MSVSRNVGLPFDERLMHFPALTAEDADMQCSVYAEYTRSLASSKRREWLLKAISLIDLTSLNGDDTPDVISKLCQRAVFTLRPETLRRLSITGSNLSCAAVCVYPARVEDAILSLKTIHKQLPVGSACGGFPSGQYKLSTKLEEIRLAIEDGATEIDVVISRCEALTGKWQTVYDEIKEMRKVCGENVHFKVILSTGELKTLENVHKASMVAMMAGADFIKTSTGKETVNATLPVSLVMCRAIKQYLQETGHKVGFKAAGGIRSPESALSFMYLVQEELGAEWLVPSLFRIGASSLLDEIERYLNHV